ncbi:Hypothetical predicted protein [Paramuricea clavata]|uniref:Uncharacterized protein n=1 Tax=Paramuricea clavata TaxID=317549 RepID=A0A7D9HFR4_PARCT|nr:Hypothetical predicted protein [Paramuricea clavata]
MAEIQFAKQNSVLSSQIDLANLTRLQPFCIQYIHVLRPKGAQIQQAKNTNPIDCRGREVGCEIPPQSCLQLWKKEITELKKNYPDSTTYIQCHMSTETKSSVSVDVAISNAKVAANLRGGSLHFLVCILYLPTCEDEREDFFLAFDSMYNFNRLRAARKLLPLPQPYNNIWLKINKVINELHIILINFICKTKYSSDLLKEKIPGLNTPVAEQTFVWAAKVNYYVRYAKVRTLKHDDKENISTLSKKRESYMTPDEIKAKKRNEEG